MHVYFFNYFISNSILLAQTIPIDHFSYQSKRKLFYDAGKDWQSLSIFGPIRFKSKSETELKIRNSLNHFDGQIGFNLDNENTIFFIGFLRFKYKKSFLLILIHLHLSKTIKNINLVMNKFFNNQDNQFG